MLNALGLRAAFALAAGTAFLAAPGPAAAQAPAAAELLSGSVRDQSGAAPPAKVLVRDAAGRVVGTAATGRDGTFTALLDGTPAEVEVVCAHCAPFRVRAGSGPLVLIVTRFRALAGGAPDAADLAALPYRDPAQAVALTPYVVALQTAAGRVASLSDRGLQNGDGLILDDGVPAYDPASADPGLFAFPARSLASVSLTPASQAFSYGSFAGGGTFGLDTFGADQGGSSAFDFGQDFALGARLRAGAFEAALADSRDADGVARERFDLAAAGEFAGGTLRGVASVASQTSNDLDLADDRSRALAGLTYTRVSERALTQIVFDALEAHSAYATPDLYAPQIASTADSLEARLRVERPAWITYAYGLLLRSANGSYGATPGAPPEGAYASENAYVEARHDGPISVDAGLGLDNSSGRLGAGTRAVEAVVSPSLVAGAALGAFAVRAGISDSARAPTPYELLAEANPGTYRLERSALQELALDFDDSRRLRLGASLFHENVTGLEAHAVNGLGLSLAWQIAPRLSLRAWTLLDDLSTYAQSLTAQPGGLGTPLARATAWLSYEAPGGLRFDAIERGASGGAVRETDLDADVVVPLHAGFAFTAGSERERGLRRAYIGLRVPRN